MTPTIRSETWRHVRANPYIWFLVYMLAIVIAATIAVALWVHIGAFVALYASLAGLTLGSIFALVGMTSVMVRKRR